MNWLFHIKKKAAPKKSYVEFEKADLANIMTKTGATINSNTINEVHKYMTRHTNYAIENMERVIKDWKRSED